MKKMILFFIVCIIVSAHANKYDDLMTFSQVFNTLKTHYVKPVDSTKIIYGAIKGMVRELDPYTTYLTPEMYSEFKSETTGRFGGIGIELTIVDELPTVISAIEGTPAWDAGIKPGDKIMAINNKLTKELSLLEISMLVKGRLGTKLKIKIKGKDGVRDIELKRKIIKSRSVRYQNLEDGFSYYRISTFSKNTSSELKKAINNHKKKHKLNGIILDVRKNPGGLLDQAVEVANMFLSEGIIVTTNDRSGKSEAMHADSSNFEENFPIIVLIDQHSASASEILASALRDNKRAIVMGNKSFGKASVQSLMPLSDGGALKITVAEYHTPGGKPIHEVGVKPDIMIEQKAPTTKATKMTSVLDDHGVKTAFKYLKAHTLMKQSGGNN